MNPWPLVVNVVLGLGPWTVCPDSSTVHLCKYCVMSVSVCTGMCRVLVALL